MLGDTFGGPEMLRDYPRGPEVVGRPSRRSGSGQETLPEVLKWSREPPGGLKVVRRLFCVEAVVMRHFLRFESGRETLPEVQRYRETLPESGTGRRPSRRSGTGQMTLLKDQKWLRDCPKGPEVVGKHSRRSGSDRVTPPKA